MNLAFDVRCQKTSRGEQARSFSGVFQVNTEAVLDRILKSRRVQGRTLKRRNRYQDRRCHGYVVFGSHWMTAFRLGRTGSLVLEVCCGSESLMGRELDGWLWMERGKLEGLC